MPKTHQTITAEPITAQAFAPFGDVMEVGASEAIMINDGHCKRYSDLAKLENDGGKLGVSIFHADVRQTPYALSLMERHPLGSQAFIPMHNSSYLVAVAADDGGKPAIPRVFLVLGGQAININKNVWHGVLAPISGSGVFAVVDRIGSGDNLEEYNLEQVFVIDVKQGASD